jgi:hypothetical protein
MTLCASFLCKDGIVLCADSEESYGDDKAHTQKLQWYTSEFIDVAVAGAGIGYLIDYAGAVALQQFTTLPRDAADCEARVRSVMQKLYREEFKIYPVDSRSQLLIQLLFAVRLKGQPPILISADGPLVRQVTDFRVIGAELMKDVAHELHQFCYTTTEAVYASMYLLKEARNRFLGIGGPTHILTLPNEGTIHHERLWDMTEREQFFDGFRKGSYKFMLEAINPHLDDRMYREMGRVFLGLVKVLREREKNIELNVHKTNIKALRLRRDDLKRHLRKLKCKAKQSASQTSGQGR